MVAPEPAANSVPEHSIFDVEGTATQAPKEESAPNVSELELQRREQAAYERGLAAGRAEMQGEVELAREQAKLAVAGSLQKLAEDRQQYYRKVEGEVVDLVLAIARKVLYREAHVDRVVLGGVVRVALEKIAGGGQIALHVHPAAAHAWREYVAAQSNWPMELEVVADGSLSSEQVILKTSHGNTELGIDEQLTEIEKGFADLVRQKQRSTRQ
jgi:flagellar assembly protein FliH